ncbi:hypothetical protein [Klebsiella pneumoniae]|uniref:hypothetical protein n=1 Tax=Klebsiella pneumoniae TaxID=573 RepID=UPI0009BC6F5B|nr:hypothetical protein [Klebsiella pneumoniae]SLR77613.1 Uncharacterised protein [Klebsiella pneumoniae]
MDFKIKKMTVKDSREIKNEIELLAKKANAESQNLGVVLDRDTIEELEKFNLSAIKELIEFEHRFNTICSIEYYIKQKLIFSINYISAEFEQREKLKY